MWAEAVMVSSRGGRQLETAVSPIDRIAPIADAVGGAVKIICDGGIRRGAHVAKALALGADACSIGRSYLYGLVASGEAGVARALDILQEEYEQTLILVGAAGASALDRGLVERRARRWDEAAA